MDIPNSSQPLRPLEKKKCSNAFICRFFPVMSSHEFLFMLVMLNYFLSENLEITEFLLGKQMRFSIFHKL